MSKSEQPSANSSMVSTTRSGIVFRGRATALPKTETTLSPPTTADSVASDTVASDTVVTNTAPSGRATTSTAATGTVVATGHACEVSPDSWGKWVRHSETSAFLVSLVIHLLLIALLAIPISRHLVQTTESATLVEVIDPVLGGDGIGEFIDAPDLMAETARGSDGLDSPALDFSSAEMAFDGTAALATGDHSGGSEDGTGTADVAGAVGGYLLREPGNAVRAGRFTAFSRPIITVGVGDKKREEFGEPGEAPLEGQAYFIVIHIKVDPRRKTYPIGDLIGSVVGTDGYVQRVPDGMYVLDDEGKPVEVKRSKPVRVTEGVVQLLMRVKGASSGVRDNIYLKSKMLREEQNLQLIFQARPAQTAD